MAGPQWKYCVIPNTCYYGQEIKEGQTESGDCSHLFHFLRDCCKKEKKDN